MASGVSTFGAGKWLGSLFGIGQPPGRYYVGLTVAEPTVTMDGTAVTQIEPQGGGYRRQAYQVGAPVWQVDDNTITNLAAVAFPQPSANWGLITHFILCGQATFGDLYAWGQLRTPLAVAENEPPTIKPGAMLLTMFGG